MSGLNRAQLIGHLGRDPEVRSLNNGGSVVTFSMATTESWRDKATGERRDRTQWHNVVIFNEGIGKVAEQYLKKGKKCLVEGQIETREYTDKDGITRRVTEIVMRPFSGNLVLLDRAERAAPDPDSYGTTRSRETARQAAPIDDDIPF
jgi:single-strand DNA-binding protein